MMSLSAAFLREQRWLPQVLGEELMPTPLGNWMLVECSLSWRVVMRVHSTPLYSVELVVLDVALNKQMLGRVRVRQCCRRSGLAAAEAAAALGKHAMAS